MVSENFKAQLLHEIKQLNLSSEQEGELQKLFEEIIGGNERSVLSFIKELGTISKSNNEALRKKQETIIELLYKYLGAARVDSIFETLKETSSVTLEESMEQLNSLIGLENVKEQITDLINFNRIQNLRSENGLKKADKTLHLALLGNPGTAKTTVARIIGRMYKSIGLLSKGHFIEAGRTDMIAEYQGQTAIKVKRLVNKAKGGVLFIDEAYSITENDHTDSYGRECLTELTKALEDYRDDLCVIVAGYSEPMEKFFMSNPGLKSRFNTFIEFKDYDAQELLDILKLFCKKNDYKLSREAEEKISEHLREKVNAKEENFANGRLARNIFDKLTMNHAKRVISSPNLSKEDLSLITAEDFSI